MKQRGFTLIELMVVVAIIGILASIAMPNYQSYIGRAQAAESIVIVNEFKSVITDYYKQTGRFPSDNASAGIPAPHYLLGNYVQGITLDNGALHVQLGNKVHKALENKYVTIRPIVVTGSPASPISWICGYASIPKGMEPVGEDKTDLAREYLPIGCSI